MGPCRINLYQAGLFVLQDILRCGWKWVLFQLRRQQFLEKLSDGVGSQDMDRELASSSAIFGQ